MKRKKFEFLEHTADIKIKTHGKSLSGIFQNFTLAVSEYLAKENKIKPVLSKKVKLKAENTESLLYDFLDHLIYLLDAKNFVVKRARVRVKNNKLEGEVFGDKASNYEGLDHIKAATYAEMYIKKKKSGWESQVVLDV